MSQHTIPVVIPHYQAPEKLQRCLAAIEAQTELKTEVFVRDNSEDNILFTKAINEGLRRYCFNGNHDFVLILNQDAYLRPGCLQHLVDAMHAHPRIGIACPVQVNDKNQPTWFGSLEAYPWGRHAGGDMNNLPAPFDTYWANGACLLVRIEMIHEIGLLDENMRFVCSDSDYSFTARSRGWRVVVVPQAQAEHSLNASSGKTATPAWLRKVKWEDQLYFARKWLTGDVYKQLALEGSKLTDEVVRQEVGRTADALRELEGDMN